MAAPGYNSGVHTIPKTMRAVVYRGPNDLRLEEVPVPAIGRGELLVRVAMCGVCPTDIKKIQYGTVPPPRIFGHETAGTIVRIGGAVRGLRLGDRVALHHHVPCLKCHACRHHAFAQCAQYKRTGITAGFEPAGGGYAEYVRVMPFVLPSVVKIPPRNSFVEGAMLEPVNTVLKAVNRLALLPGDTVWVAGQGPIGLMFTRLLTLRGIKVVASDLLKSRLRLARSFGAKAVFQPKIQRRERGRGRAIQSVRINGAGSGDPAYKLPAGRVPSRGGTSDVGYSGVIESIIDKVSGGAGLDAAVVAVPSAAVVREAQAAVRGGGKVMLFSHTRRGDETALDLASVCVDEKDLIGSYSADITIQAEVARLVFSRQMDIRPLVTHRIPLGQTAEAVALAAKPTERSLKVVVECED